LTFSISPGRRVLSKTVATDYSVITVGEGGVACH
jgi:hypothetical protein